MSQPENQTPEEIVAREFRFGLHIPKSDKTNGDYHFVKEQVHVRIGDKIEVRPTLRVIKDFKRPVFFTKPSKRTHKEKKEVEHLDNLIRMDVTQSDLKKTVARMIDHRFGYASLRDLCASPYVYAADIPSTLFIRKHLYRDKYPNINTPRTVAMFDTETDMLLGKKDIIMATVCFQNKCIVAVQKRVLEGFAGVEHRFQLSCEKHLKKYIEERKLEIEFYIGETELDVVRQCFNFLHEVRPDFLAIWNMDFDIPKVLAACENAGVDPKDILCDPRIPPELRVCEYVRGQTSQKTASGKHKPIRNANQWHTLNLTASFYVIDAMCAYRRIRWGPELSSYALDDILFKELGIRKLMIPEAEKHKKAKWHVFMQENFIFEYIVYNIFDSFSMLLLDEKTKDLSRTLPFLADLTNFDDYASQTKRLRDNFYVFGIENLQCALASLGPKKKDKKTNQEIDDDDSGLIHEDDEEEDENLDDEDQKRVYKTLDRRNWVVTLRSFMTVLGLPLILENPKIRTLIRAFTYDSDVVSSYPNCILVANVSKITTRKEISCIVGIPEQVFRMQNLNMVFGPTNHAEYSQIMFGMPTFHDLNKAYQVHLQQR